MSQIDTVIRNGTLVTPRGTFPGDVGIIGEHIVAVGGQLRGNVELDATGCYVLPGGIDPHVHLQMPVGTYITADDFVSGTVAAACGGTTTVIDFVEPEPGERLSDALAKRRADADGRVAVDYGLHMTIPTWHANHEDALGEIAHLTAAGITSFKIYQAGEGFLLDDVQLYRVLAAVAAAGGLPIVHSENGPLCEQLRAEALAAGHTTPRYHALTRPPRQEAQAVSCAVDIAALAHSPLYIVHVSCAEALARIAAARARGEAVYGETCPQYLVLTEQALDGPCGEQFVCSPPLRSPDDQAALWTALSRGELDVVATDHCPFMTSEKKGHASFATIPGGLPSLEARLSLVYTQGVCAGRLSLERWAEVCCAAPARLFGLARKGHLAPGYDADLVVYDPQAKATLNTETLHEKLDWTPYEGMPIHGSPRYVLSRGRIIAHGGEFVGEPGWGCFVSRDRWG